MTILIAEDSKIIIEGILKVLNDDIEVSGITTNGIDTVNWLKSNTVDVLLLDIKMPFKDGIQVLEDLKELGINQRTVIYSEFDSEVFVKRTFELGALGYILKDDATNEINTAINKAYKNKMHLSTKIFDIALEIEEKRENYDKLSIKEKQILHLLYDNLEYKEVQEKLNIGTSTFHTFTQRIRKKLNLKNNAGLARYINIID